jgi:hypothetical protein
MLTYADICGRMRQVMPAVKLALSKQGLKAQVRQKLKA